MKKPVTPSTKPAEEIFSALLVVMVLLVLPLIGPIAMMSGSTIGFAMYVWLFPDRFRSSAGSLKLAIGLAAFLAVLTGVVIAMSLAGQLK